MDRFYQRNTLDEGHLRIEIGQVSPSDGGFEEEQEIKITIVT